MGLEADEKRSDTVFAFGVFKTIPEDELCELLWLAGVTPADTHPKRVKQALHVWFKNQIPDPITLDQML